LPLAFKSPQLPNSLLYLVSLIVILVLAAVLFFAGRWWLRRSRLSRESQSLENLAEITRASLAEISSGKEWEDAIIQAYARMSQVVGARRGLQRRPNLTAAEFIARLEAAGLPAQAVRRLTHLFEIARYGTRQASREDMAEAVACLTAVLHACGVDQ
jgi:Flp pilus assembly protein TadB